MEEETKLQVNVDFTPFPELYKDLEEMAAEDSEGNRSAFIRKLVRQEKARRAQLPLPLPISKKASKRPSAVVTA